MIAYSDFYGIEEFEELDYCGISFTKGEERYQLIHNFHMGNRLLINNLEENKDIPFKEETFHLLPEDIKVVER